MNGPPPHYTIQLDPNAGLMLATVEDGSNINPILGQRPVFAGSGLDNNFIPGRAHMPCSHCGAG